MAQVESSVGLWKSWLEQISSACAVPSAVSSLLSPAANTRVSCPGASVSYQSPAGLELPATVVLWPVTALGSPVLSFHPVLVQRLQSPSTSPPVLPDGSIGSHVSVARAPFYGPGKTSADGKRPGPEVQAHPAPPQAVAPQRQGPTPATGSCLG